MKKIVHSDIVGNHGKKRSVQIGIDDIARFEPKEALQSIVTPGDKNSSALPLTSAKKSATCPPSISMTVTV